MSYYFIANINISDTTEYQKYIDAADAVFNKFNGEYLAVDDVPDLLEGQNIFHRMVIIRFPSENDFRKWYDSEEYSQIRKIRLKASVCSSVGVHGKK